MDHPLTVRALEQKAALKQMFDESGIPFKALADMLGVAYSTFMAWIDPSQDIHMPSHRMPVALAICSKSTAFTSYLASLQNSVVTRLPDPGESDLDRLDAVLLEMSHILRTHASAIADGQWTRAEAKNFKTVAARLQSAIAAEVLHVERKAVDVVAIAERKRA
jgi:hypothetical protein